MNIMSESLPVKHDKHNSTSRGKGEQAGLREAIWFDSAVFESSHVILILLHIAIESGKIKIG